MIRTLCQLTVIVFTVVFAAQSTANDPVSTGYWNNVAIGGHDVLSYQKLGRQSNHDVLQGRKIFTVSWQGADWQFASQASADKFAANPEKYVPRYNGFCANALSLGEGLIPTGGQVWEFFGEQLYLFYAERGRQRWLKGNWQDYQKAADQAWHQLAK